jgi:glycosyltransferase involved in cell wall biosynthesis
MLLAGQVFPYREHEQYFREEILPRLGSRHRFLGPVGFERKRRLLAAAKCVVIPSLAPETSSLVAMEALACGTPVVAFRTGALPEIVDDRETGFIVSTESEMADALAKVHLLDSDLCRRRVQERFSAARMLARYMTLYREIAASGTVRGSTALTEDGARDQRT